MSSDNCCVDAEKARTALSNVSGALCDSGVVVPAEEWRYGEAVREIVAERDDYKGAYELTRGKYTDLQDIQRAAANDMYLLRMELGAARADYAACAEAIGIVYEADGHATQPGPREAVVEHIRQSVREAGRFQEAEGRMFEMKEKLAMYETTRMVCWDRSTAAKDHDGTWYFANHGPTGEPATFGLTRDVAITKAYELSKGGV